MIEQDDQAATHSLLLCVVLRAGLCGRLQSHRSIALGDVELDEL